MSRYAKANVTIDDLKNKISKVVCGDDQYSFEDAIWQFSKYVNSTISKDLSKVQFDDENVDLVGNFDMPGLEDMKPLEMLGDFPVAWVAAGGDWEEPIVFVLYVGDNGELRAYIPKDGNAYDHKGKCAYGNGESDEDELNDGKITGHLFDSTKLREDVKNRIVVKQKDF